MDFGTLLHKAQKNGNGEKKEIKYYSTKFEPPKKEQRTKTLSANIQKFLARKEEEERRKQDDANKKRDQLLELRSKDKKATRRVNVMLKRTKSANQSVIQDAVDSYNTSVTLAGPSQPDEDDYGYVSQSASEYYNKMMEKYSKMPDEPKFNLAKKKVSTNLSSTKQRVKEALDREAEEAMQPHRRKRKRKETSDGTNDPDDKEPDEKYDKYEKKEEKPMKPKLKPAPVINFSDLLKMAEKKQFEPIVIEQKKEKEEERLLTKRQRREMEREKEYRERRELREQQSLSSPSPAQPPPIPKINKIPKVNGESSKPSEPAPAKKSAPPKSNGENRIPKNSDFKVPKPNGLNERVPKKQVDERSNIRPQPSSSNKSAADIKPKIQKTPEVKKPDRAVDRSKMNGKDVKGRPSVPQGRPKDFPPRDLKPKQEVKSRQDLKPKQEVRPKQFPPNDLKPKQFPPNDLKPKQFPPRDLKPKQFPPPDMRRPPGGGMKRKPLVSKGRIYDDDDEDYDSEMDDFIDDGPDEEEDYSKYISEIFGYDKKKYRYCDDDVDDMETSFAGQMREEVISTKIGIMEDLEDMKQEEQAKRRKALLKKKQKR